MLGRLVTCNDSLLSPDSHTCMDRTHGKQVCWNMGKTFSIGNRQGVYVQTHESLVTEVQVKAPVVQIVRA